MLIIFQWIVLSILSCLSFAKQCWSSYGEYEYMVMSHQGSVHYGGAIEACNAINASLVSIHSLEEHRYIDQLRETQVGVPVWIGMRSFGLGLLYLWSDETPVDYLPEIESFTEPLDVACLFLYKEWYEGHCGNYLHFICKRTYRPSVESCPVLTTTSDIINSTSDDNTTPNSVQQTTYNETDHSTTVSSNTPGNDNTTPDSVQQTTTNETNHSETVSSNTTPNSVQQTTTNETNHSETVSSNTTPNSVQQTTTNETNHSITVSSNTPGNDNTSPHSVQETTSNETDHSITESSNTPGNDNTTPNSVQQTTANETDHSLTVSSNTPGNDNTTPNSVQQTTSNETDHSLTVSSNTPGNDNTTPNSVQQTTSNETDHSETTIGNENTSHREKITSVSTTESSQFQVTTETQLTVADVHSTVSSDATTTESKESKTTTRRATTTTYRKPDLIPEEINEKVQEIVKNLKIYKLPKHSAREAPGGEAIGAVALFILIGIIGGIVLLDLVTIQNHLKLFLRNIRRRPYRKRQKECRETQTANEMNHQDQITHI